MSPATTTRTCRTCKAPIPSAHPEFVVACVDPNMPGIVGFYHAYDNRCIKASAQHVLDHPGEMFKAAILVLDEQAAERN